MNSNHDGPPSAATMLARSVGNLSDRKKVMILDDHPVVRSGLVTLLSSDALLFVAGEFNRSQQLLFAMARNPPDLALVDYQLAPDDCDGLNLLMRLRKYHQTTKIVVVSAIELQSNISAALRAGAHAFVGKSQTPDTLMKTVRSVLRGAQYRIPTSGRLDEDRRSPHIKLSDREREVLRCCLEGMPTKAIAEKFNRQQSTISTQKSSAYRKLGIRSDQELFRFKDRIMGLLDHEE
jgi:DNA-binding NarL/FixJ family response regulator